MAAGYAMLVSRYEDCRQRVNTPDAGVAVRLLLEAVA